MHTVFYSLFGYKLATCSNYINKKSVDGVHVKSKNRSDMRGLKFTAKSSSASTATQILRAHLRKIETFLVALISEPMSSNISGS